MCGDSERNNRAMDHTSFYLSVLGILLPLAVLVGKAAIKVDRAATDIAKVLRQYPPHVHTPDGFIQYPDGYEAPTFETFGEPRSKKARGAGSSE